MAWYGRRRPAAGSPDAASAPPLPPGRLVPVPARGETFVRELPAAGDGGATILLLHGWLLCADVNWYALYAGLARHGRVLAMDVRGHGRGPRGPERFRLEDAADDAAALLEHLGATPAVVVGYSMGGSIALLLAQRHPEAVAGLVLQSTALQWRQERSEQVLWRLMGGLHVALRTGAARAVEDRYFAWAARRNPALEDVLPWLVAEASRGDPVDLAEAGRALGAFDARPYVWRIAAPTAVVVSRRDRLVAPRRQYELAGAIPGASVVDADMGHNAWLVRPDVLAAAVDEALALVVGRPADGAGEFGAVARRGDPPTARTP